MASMEMWRGLHRNPFPCIRKRSTSNTQWVFMELSKASLTVCELLAPIRIMRCRGGLGRRGGGDLVVRRHPPQRPGARVRPLLGRQALRHPASSAAGCHLFGAASIRSYLGTHPWSTGGRPAGPVACGAGRGAWSRRWCALRQWWLLVAPLPLSMQRLSTSR